jgi:hypothetical protein
MSQASSDLADKRGKRYHSLDWIVGECEKPSGKSYETNSDYSGASCVATLIEDRSLRGRISVNPIRKIPYAVRTPNAIEPIAAHINITKLNASAIPIDPR